MAKQWRIKKEHIHGGISGKLLEGCEIRENDDGSLEFLAVLAKAHGNGQPTRDFPQFAYQGLIWTITCTPEGAEAPGTWFNNVPKTVGEEDGTYTAQAGPHVGSEEEGKEDAASASA